MTTVKLRGLPIDLHSWVRMKTLNQARKSQFFPSVFLSGELGFNFNRQVLQSIIYPSLSGEAESPNQVLPFDYHLYSSPAPTCRTLPGREPQIGPCCWDVICWSLSLINTYEMLGRRDTGTAAALIRHKPCRCSKSSSVIDADFSWPSSPQASQIESEWTMKCFCLVFICWFPSGGCGASVIHPHSLCKSSSSNRTVFVFVWAGPVWSWLFIQREKETKQTDQQENIKKDYNDLQILFSLC